ncbi:hypothetical protein L210DRAFT_690220 [Boletus edulis BED1]|uniref:Uncharacterized protein n=1 Tax=Boletus edulis BED1 TaxID=1328754 RepID=A0AAD4C7I3_BOLED|nr:hypothetical protein L210DRAFT_690220 [Boletus edulis BED1]
MQIRFLYNNMGSAAHIRLLAGNVFPSIAACRPFILEALITACATMPRTRLCTRLLRLYSSLRYHRSSTHPTHAAVLASFLSSRPTSSSILTFSSQGVRPSSKPNLSCLFMLSYPWQQAL